MLAKRMGKGRGRLFEAEKHLQTQTPQREQPIGRLLDISETMYQYMVSPFDHEFLARTSSCSSISWVLSMSTLI